MPAGSAAPSPRPSPPASAAHSPPLTPAVTSREGKTPTGHVTLAQAQRARAQGDSITPQRSTSPGRSRPGSGGEPTSHPRPTPRFSIGPSESEDTSPVTTPGATTPTSRQPTRDAKKQSVSDVDSVEARFRFGNRDPRHGFGSSGSSTALANHDKSATDLASSLVSGSASTANLKIDSKPSSRHSFFGGNKHSGSDENLKDKPASSSSNLKRFFKFGGHKNKEKKAHSPTREGSQSTASGAMPVSYTHLTLPTKRIV